MANNFTCSKLNNFDADTAANQVIELSQVPGQTFISWKATSSEDWVTLNPDSGTGSDVIIVAVSDNTTGSARSAAIIITDTENGGMDTIMVTQEAGVSEHQSSAKLDRSGELFEKSRKILKKVPVAIIIILLLIIAYGVFKGYPGNNNGEISPASEDSAFAESTPDSIPGSNNNNVTYQLGLNIVDENGVPITADALGTPRSVSTSDYTYSGNTWHLKVMDGTDVFTGETFLTASNDAVIVTKNSNGLWKVSFFNDLSEDKNVILTVKADNSVAKYQIAIRPLPTENADDGNGLVDGTVAAPETPVQANKTVRLITIEDKELPTSMEDLGGNYWNLTCEGVSDITVVEGDSSAVQIEKTTTGFKLTFFNTTDRIKNIVIKAEGIDGYNSKRYAIAVYPAVELSVDIGIPNVGTVPDPDPD